MARASPPSLPAGLEASVPGAAAGLGQPRANQNPCVWPVQGDHAQEATKLPATPMNATNNTSIATTEVLVSPKGEMIAVAPLTNEKGSLLSACATPCNSNLPRPSSPV